ncbi:MAG: magnesium transporter CorA family protein [Propionicimonas sp.]
MENPRSLVWRDGIVVARDLSFADLERWRGATDAVVWLDLVAPSREVLDELAADLGLSALAVDDVIEPKERPKVTRYERHAFLTCYAVDLDHSSDGRVEVRLGRLSAFVLPDALITVRSDDQVDIERIVNRWVNDDLVGHGVAALVHGMLDEVVDGHFDVITTLDEEMDDLEDLLFERDRKSAEIQQRVFALRKALVRLRRVVLPMREVVTAVMRFRDENDIPLSGELEGYFNDLYDHVIRAAEWTESLRDMISSVFETNLSLQDARLNEVMKKLAAWAAIIAVPTAVTGWFGQNIPYPGFAHESGLIQSVVLILVGSVGLYLLFRRADWI